MNQQGWYTAVISDDVTRPDWLPAPIAWMPWGDEQFQKWFFYRHMIPVQSEAEYDSADLFPWAIQPDAVLDFTPPNLPPRADFTNTGRSTQKIMGDYYPVAVWCDKDVFEHGGWQACLRDQLRAGASNSPSPRRSFQQVSLDDLDVCGPAS